MGSSMKIPLLHCLQESPTLPASDIYAEAKNWAGELISGQTRAGKILVKVSCSSIQIHILMLGI